MGGGGGGVNFKARQVSLLDRVGGHAERLVGASLQKTIDG